MNNRSDTEVKENKKSERMSMAQFCIAVYVRADYEAKQEAAGNLYSEWSGVEFGNSWRDGLDRANEIVKKNPEHTCVVIDMMRRKKPVTI